MESSDILSVQQQYSIIGRSPKLLRAIYSAIQAAPYDVNVLVIGENGVGKEMFHKIIHNNSPRKFKKCVVVNCGGLPEGTIDSELFGHVKGAFTGALADRKGYFEEADGSTIFLDEVGELPLATQARLLRVIEAGEYYRVGSSEIRKTNVRIVAATNVDLQAAIKKGTFREDLFYRLSTITIEVPALRERPEDIYLLFRKFASDIASKYHMPPIMLEPDAQRRLVAYQWPGNIRQLLHIVEELSIVETERSINAETLSHYLPAFDDGISIMNDDSSDHFKPGEKELLYKIIFELRQDVEMLKNQRANSASTHHQPSITRALPAALPMPNDETNYSIISVNEEPHKDIKDISPCAESIYPQANDPEEIMTLEEIEKNAIKTSLLRNKYSKKKVAQELGISERTLYRKIDQYQLEDNENKE